MTEEKWYKIVVVEFAKIGLLNKSEEWPQFKKEVANFVKEIDEATEVLNMEKGN